MTASTGIITTVAGGGTVCAAATDSIGDGCTATSATLSTPYQVVLDANQNLFIADSGNARIREVLASSGVIQTVAGGGTGCNAQTDTFGDGCTPTQASLFGPAGVFVDAHGNLFISDSSDERIREVSVSTGLIQTIAGTGAGGYNGDGILATTAEVYYPAGLFVDSSGDVFFADVDNERIREIVASTNFIQTLAGGGEGCTGETDTFGDGCPANEAFMVPYGVTVDASSNIYIADEGFSLVREVVSSTGVIQPFAGNGKPSFSGDGGLAKNAQLFYATALLRMLPGTLTSPISITSAFEKSLPPPASSRPSPEAALVAAPRPTRMETGVLPLRLF
ncbi:MAG: hypothetical protein WBL50_04220 [Candidatus Acidiferrum sp.]